MIWVISIIGILAIFNFVKTLKFNKINNEQNEIIEQVIDKLTLIDTENKNLLKALIAVKKDMMEIGREL